MGTERTDGSERASVEAAVGRALASYAEIAKRFGPIGGLERVFQLYEQIRLELDRVEFREIDATAQEIKAAVETLLAMDYELRRLNNLKVALGGGGKHEG